MTKLEFHPNFSAVVVTGGPCAGKSTFMAIARQYLEDRGMRVAVQQEVATEFITSGFSPVEGWQNPLIFQEFLLSYMLYRERLYYNMLICQDADKPMVLLCDRGALDAMAYVGRLNFLRAIDNLDINLHELRERYRAVIHLVTAAVGAEEHYTLANNTARSEGLKEARELDSRTAAAWIGHQHMFIVDNSTGFDEKVRRALTTLARVLNMPTPKEKERKFILKNWRKELAPGSVVSVEIVQTYLEAGESGRERRVRMRTVDGASSYYYTRKSDTAEVGVRHEEEEQVSRSRYEELLLEQDLATMSVVKTRHCMQYEGHTLEVDEYHSPIDTLVVLEVEVTDMNELIVLPPEWQVEEVTGKAKYKNRMIAEGSLTI